MILAVLLLFGSKKIPELAKGLGQGIKEFKKATREVTDEIQNTPADSSSAKPLNRLTEMGFLTLEPDGFQSVPEMKVMVQKA